MAVTLYKWDDASAPAILNSGTGLSTLLDILDACLVNGYGAKTAAGWTKPFANAGNIGCYKNSVSTGGTGTHYRIDDTDPKDSRIVAYENMSDINTGTFPFPTETQVPGGLNIRKLVNATIGNAANDGKWYVVANERAAHVFLQIGPSPTYGSFYFFIGDIISFGPTDTYKGYIQADIGIQTNYNPGMVQVGANTTSPGRYFARDISGLTLSFAAGMHGNLALCDSYLGYGNTVRQAFPNPIDGNLIITNIFLTHPDPQVVRGMMPGLKAPCHRRPFTNLMTHTGDGDLAGKTFLAMDVGFGTASGSQVLVETSDTWYV
jgi:hypothetical protein